MSDLLIPDHVAHERVNASMERQADGQMEMARIWTEELRRIDPTLSIVWVDENADDFDHPGRWHLRKPVPGSFDEWWPLIGPNGEYREPGAWLLDALNANDMWNPRVHRSKKEAAAKHREAKRRAKEHEAGQRVDEMALANRAARRINGDGGMTKRTDLQVPAVIAAERRMKRAAESAGLE